MAWRYDPEKFEAMRRANREAATKQAIAEMDAMHPRHGLCYFVGSIEAGIVKIGYSRNLWQRVSAIKARSGPFRLSLLACINGGSEREGHYHHRFEDHCVGGEWFELAPAIQAEIDRINELPVFYADYRGDDDLAASVKTKLAPPDCNQARPTTSALEVRHG